MGLAATLGALGVYLGAQSSFSSFVQSATFFKHEREKPTKDPSGDDPHHHSPQPTITVEYGSLVSFACYYPESYYLRQVKFMFMTKEIEETEEFRLDSSFIIDEGLAGVEGTVSIRSLFYPDYYIRVKNGYVAVLEQIDYQDEKYNEEASFYIRKGLADPNLFSFEFLSMPGYYLRQLDDQVVAYKFTESYHFKDDATWFIRPAHARVSHISINFFENQVESSPSPDIIVYNKTYFNPSENPEVLNYLQTSMESQRIESFEKTAGFHLLKGMTYKLNAKQPRVDTNGNVFFTVKSVRDWTYGHENSKNISMMFESEVIAAPDGKTTTLQVILKQMKVSVPFEAEVHFEKVDFTQQYHGIWHGVFTYDYEIKTFEAIKNNEVKPSESKGYSFY